MDTSIPPNVYNDDSVFVPLMKYNGDAAAAPFVFESGYLGQGSEGVLLEMNAAHTSRLSTSHYLLYGNVTARLRHNATAGLVTSFGTASDVGDAIVFEVGGTNKSRVATNLAALGNAPSALGVDAKVPHFSFENWHNYTIAWTPNKITWLVDQNVVRSVTRAQAESHFPRSPSRILFTVRGTTSGSSKRERQWAGGTLDMTGTAFRDRGYYAQELSHLQVTCAELSQSNVSITGVGDAPVAYYYTGRNNSASGEPAFELSRDQIRLLSDPALDGKPGMPGWPGAAPNGPRPNMYTGGDGRSPRPAPSRSSSDGVKIGVPVAIGGAVFLGGLAILVYYFVRRHRRAQRRPPSVIDPTPYVDVVSPAAAPAYPLSAYEPAPSADPQERTYPRAYSPTILTPDDSGAHAKEPLVHDEDYYYQDPWAVTQDDDRSDELSTESEAPKHMHYAGHGTLRRYDPRLTEAENERLAAQDAWEELRSAALGDDAPFFQTQHQDDASSRLSAVHGPFRARRGTHRAAYSDGGALGPPPAHTPTLSVSGSTGWHPRAPYDV